MLAPDAVIFADDYAWDGAQRPAERFAREQRLAVSFSADKWVLRKAR